MASPSSRRVRTFPVAVIGAGFSGTMAAIRLLAALPDDRTVLVCERGGRFARGLAFGTKAADHLLNVRAANMSAYPDRPRHFETWLADLAATEGGGLPGVRSTPAGTLAPRRLYGRYLTKLLARAVTARGSPRRHLVHDAVADLASAARGYTLRTEGGQTVEAAGAVLAVGRPRGARRAVQPASGRPVAGPESFGRLRPHLPVLIVGTGLVRRAGNQVDFVDDDRVFLAPSLTWRPDADASLSNDQTDKAGWGLQCLPALGTVRPNLGRFIPRTRFLGIPGQDCYDTEQASIGDRFEHRFSDEFVVRQNARFSHFLNDQIPAYGAGYAKAASGELARFGGTGRSNLNTSAVNN